MKDYVARAMQMASLDRLEIEKVHATEKSAKFIIPNWNLQIRFGFRPVKDSLNIPADDMAAHATHSAKIESELLRNQYLPAPAEDGEIANLMRIHAMDWKVFENPGKINFSYAGPKNTGNVRSRIQEETPQFS